MNTIFENIKPPQLGVLIMYASVTALWAVITMSIGPLYKFFNKKSELNGDSSPAFSYELVSGFYKLFLVCGLISTFSYALWYFIYAMNHK